MEAQRPLRVVQTQARLPHKPGCARELSLPAAAAAESWRLCALCGRTPAPRGAATASARALLRCRYNLARTLPPARARARQIDAVIIGGYYGSGRNGGVIGEFLMGLPETGGAAGTVTKWISFCK